LLDQLLGYFRDVMTQAVGCDASSLLYCLPSQQQEVHEIAEQLGVHTLLAIVQILDQTAARMRVSTHTRTLTEMAIVRICHLEDLDELSALIAQLQSGRAVTGTVSPGKKVALVKKNELPKPATVAVTAPPQTRTSPITAQPTSVAANGDGAAHAEPIDTTPSVSEVTAETPRSPSCSLSPESVEEIWKQVLNSLSGMVMDHAAEANEISVDAAGQITVSFRESFHCEICQRPANRTRLEQALESVCGTKVGIVLRTLKQTKTLAKPATRAPSKRQQQAEIVTQPFVKKAMELFDGDPGRLRYVPPEEK